MRASFSRPLDTSNIFSSACLTRVAVVQLGGFIVFNPQTYSKFLRFLALQKRSVEVIKTQMTFSVSRDGGAFERAGDGLHSVFCQPRRVFDLAMWRMLFDIKRLNACAVRVHTIKGAGKTNATFALCVVLLELYYADSRRRARDEEGKRPSVILYRTAKPI